LTIRELLWLEGEESKTSHRAKIYKSMSGHLVFLHQPNLKRLRKAKSTSR